MSKNMITSPSLRRSQEGMVAIMTTMVLMIVITLIVLGFAQLSRRTQRESLDRQLTTQAFYAAESGVNDAREIIKQAAAEGREIAEKTDCMGSGPGAFYAGLDPTIDADKNVKYTCLLVNPSPKSLDFNSVGMTGEVVPFISASGDALSTITLEWQAKDSSTPTAGCPSSTVSVFAAATSWNCGYGILRFDLVPTNGSSLDISTLQSTTMTTFAVPSGSVGSNSISYTANTGNTNNVMNVRCTDTNCNLTITGLDKDNYHMRIMSLYRNVSLKIHATNVAGDTLELKGAQVVIDSTGKAQDVLRRIQVHVPVRATNQNELSDYAIKMNASLCKRYAITNGYIDNKADVTGGDRLCQLFTSP